ncbi:hypothetical protein BG004_006461, partial [Podila humilis]
MPPIRTHTIPAFAQHSLAVDIPSVPFKTSATITATVKNDTTPGGAKWILTLVNQRPILR